MHLVTPQLSHDFPSPYLIQYIFFLFYSSTFTRGIHTFSVPPELFKTNRQTLCERLRKIKQIPANSYVLLQGGESETRYCSDHEPLFRQVIYESFFSFTLGTDDIFLNKYSAILF